MRHDPVSPVRLRHAAVLLCFSVLVVTLVSLHTYHFSGRNYRQDEAWLVHWAVMHAEQPGGLPAVLLHNVSQVATEYWPMDVWVYLFGQAEVITRFLATLLTTLSLACLFRLGKDLFNASVGLFAVFILGSLAFFQFFSHETRAYPALVAGTIALLLVFERWLVTRRWRYVILYVLLAVATVYIHLYIVYVIAAQALFFVLFVKWDRPLWQRTFGMFAAAGFLSLPRLYGDFLHYQGPQGGINWYSLKTNLDALLVLHSQMQITPAAIGQFLLLLGFLVPIRAAFPHRPLRMFRLAKEWRRAYLIALPITILILAFGINLLVNNVTPRNLIVILPPLAILTGYALMLLPRQARVVIVLLIAVPAVTSFQPYIANGPYREMTNFIQADYQHDDRFIVDGAYIWQHVPITYFVEEQLSERVPNASLFHLGYFGERGVNSLPDRPIHWASDDSAASLKAFRAFIDHAQRIWYLQGAPVGFSSAYQAILDKSYIRYRVQTWGADQNYPPHTFIEYRRIPQQFENPYVFDNNFTLRHWELKNDTTVTPCETVTLESWWSIQKKPATNYSMTLALADSTGMGIAHNDGSPAGILTQLWKPNQLYLDSRSITVPCDIQPGDYSLIVNLYDYQTLKSLPITNASQNTAYLTTLQVR